MLNEPNWQPLEHRPTPESRLMVEKLYAANVPIVRIAARFDISDETLRKYYRKELDESLDKRRSDMVEKLRQDAENGNHKARELWLKTIGALYYTKAPENTGVAEVGAALVEFVKQQQQKKD